MKNIFSGRASMIHRNLVLDDFQTDKNTPARAFARSTKFNTPLDRSCRRKVKVTFLVVPESTVHVGLDCSTVFNESPRLFSRPSHKLMFTIQKKMRTSGGNRSARLGDPSRFARQRHQVRTVWREIHTTPAGPTS